MNRGVSLLLLGSMTVLTGCDSGSKKPAPQPVIQPDFVTYLPFSGSPLDVLADDMDGDGRIDIAATQHGQNYSQIFYQSAPGQFRPGPRLDAVGFHPGDWLRWPGADPLYVAAAEGSAQMINFRVNTAGGMDVLSRVPALMPRHVRDFHWPGWGTSLAVSPFELGALHLMKNYDPVKGTREELITVNLGEGQTTIRRLDRVTAADINGDGIEELLFASSTTGEVFKVSYPRTPDAKPVIEVLAELGDAAPRQVLALELNGDGAVDLIVPNEIDPYQINLLINKGDGGFRPARSTWPFVVQNGMRCADLNHDRDGRDYLAVLGYGALALYQVPAPWDEVGQPPVKFITIGARGMSLDIVMRDIDGDGWLDIVAGYPSAEHGLVIIRGPLWEHMDELAKQHFVLK